MTSLNKNYTTMAGSDNPSTIDDTNQTQIGEIEADMTTIETDLTAVETEKADKTNVLELNNTDTFTPSNDYEPATKKYVDDSTPALGTDDITNDSTVTGATASDALETNASNLTTHEADTTTHGTTGDIVGDTDTQELTNKTMDSFTNDIHANGVHHKVKCVEATGILKGNAVAQTGWNDGENAIEVVLADNTVTYAIGLAHDDMANGDYDGMVTAGTIHDIDTSAWSLNDILYVNGSGVLTNVKPTTGLEQPIARVLRVHATLGDIQVQAQASFQDAEAVRFAPTGIFTDEKNVNDALNKLGDTFQVANDPTGFDRQNPDTMGTITFTAGTRTLEIDVKGGESEFSFYHTGIKYTKTSAESVVIADTDGMHFVYYDDDGVLKTTATFDEALVIEDAIVAVIYWNATDGDYVVFGDERHGLQMDGYTHLYNHSTWGALYSSGLDIEGLTAGVGTFTQTTSGVFFDEDIKLPTPAQTTAPFWYRDGATGIWTKTTADNLVAKMGTTYAQWNENTSGTIWQLTETSGPNDHVVYLQLATNNIDYPVIKVIGQNLYASASSARDGIQDEINNISLEGLPTPEFIFINAIIVDRTGNVVALSDGSTHLDLRGSQGSGSGGSSVASNYHADLLDLLTSGHPAGIISYDNATSGLTATDTQDAIDEVNDNLVTHEADVANPHSVTINQVTPTTTKGDILVENGSNVIRVPVGANTEILSANSAEASGVEWVSAGTPSAHASSHEDGGADEIDLTGLTVGVGNVVGTDATQTLSNKTLDTPVIKSWDEWQPYTGTMPVFSSTTDGVDTLTLTDADDFLQKGTKVEITASTSGVTTAYVVDASATDFELAGETSVSGTITAMRYSYADAPFGFKKGEDWYKARHYMTSDKTALANSTPKKLSADVASFDPNGNVNTTTTWRYDSPITGTFQVNTQAQCNGIAELTIFTVYIYVNGLKVTWGNRAGYATSSASWILVSTSALIKVNRGDYVEVFAQVQATTDRTLTASEEQNFMDIQFTGI